jgi:hypothetical protein
MDNITLVVTHHKIPDQRPPCTHPWHQTCQATTGVPKVSTLVTLQVRQPLGFIRLECMRITDKIRSLLHKRIKGLPQQAIQYPRSTHSSTQLLHLVLTSSHIHQHSYSLVILTPHRPSPNSFHHNIKQVSGQYLLQWIMQHRIIKTIRTRAHKRLLKWRPHHR